MYSNINNHYNTLNKQYEDLALLLVENNLKYYYFNIITQNLIYTKKNIHNIVSFSDYFRAILFFKALLEKQKLISKLIF